jgi:hypothetical protein
MDKNDSSIEIKKYRFTAEQIAALQRIQWWNWDEERLKEISLLFNDINAFIKKHDVL